MPLDWSEEEIILAMEFYFACPEKCHTDSHPKCKEVAASLDRTPGALDRIIRNIKYADTGGTGLQHASKRIYNLVHQYSKDQAALMKRAAEIRTNNGLAKLDCGG